MSSKGQSCAFRFLYDPGQIRRNACDFKRARADFDEAIRFFPREPGNYYEHALVLKRLGRTPKSSVTLGCILIAIVPMAIATTTKSSTLQHCFAT